MISEDPPRLIEVAFPLQQASIDSVHEKWCHEGHPKAIHIWPARRPLAACRAALVSALLPDPGNEPERRRLLDKLAGRVVIGPTGKPETEGGILHWGRENGPDLDFFREEIRKAYGGRAPRVLDPFAGGGAIPLEAMRLGCEATAIDINPVAWFILKCTLEYPQKLAGQHWPLPELALQSPEFVEKYLKGAGAAKKGHSRKAAATQDTMLVAPEADLAWHVRAWGNWVLERARKDLERFYPTVGGKPTVAYLWARTVTCKNCRATLPLLKTMWLYRKDNKRWRLKISPRLDRTGVDFQVVEEPKASGSAAQQRAYDAQIGRGTMSRSGAWCPVCGNPSTVAMTMDDLRAEGMAGRMGAQMTAVVVEGAKSKEYRLPAPEEIAAATEAAQRIDEVFKDVPFGLPTEPLPSKEALGFRVPLYGIDQWHKLFTLRQLVALGTFVKHIRAAREAMRAERYPEEWVQSLGAYLACVLCKVADYNSTLVTWQPGSGKGGHSFARWALPITWDFSENNLLVSDSGGYRGIIDWIAKPISGSLATATWSAPPSESILDSILGASLHGSYDLIVTDPPYYDAIPYSDLMDFFYIWIRRVVAKWPAEFEEAFVAPLAPKWDDITNDGELIDDASRFGGDSARSKAAYEDGMFRAFVACRSALSSTGRMVVVFANKQPDAWETLVSAIIRAGFVVEASWPIETEMGNRTRAMASAALASSVWLVCRKRPETARPGWDNQVLAEMKERIYDRLRAFWDAGIRGPDFVWAATGPALEAYSKHPVVKKADQPDALMTASEFLSAVRRIVVDYVVGRVLSRNGESREAEELDNVTIYYLLHRYDFGLGEAPVGASILYAMSCGLRDRDLVDRYGLLSYGKGKAAADAEEEEGEDATEEMATSGSTVRLKLWDQRSGRNFGLPTSGKPAPMIDQAHRLMQLWKTGDVHEVDAYIEDAGIAHNALFPRVLQALVELARKDNPNGEVVLLETIMNHKPSAVVRAPKAPKDEQMKLEL